MTNGSIGRWSSFAVFLIGLAYVVALGAGFAVYGLSAPITGRLLAIMESLTLSAAPLLIAMMAAIHGRARAERRTMSTIALAFMILASGITSGVHFVGLTAHRQLGIGDLVWPSTAYALELLAWDVFLGFSLGVAALTFNDSGRERRVRRTMLACAALCLCGTTGPLTGNMRLQFIGIVGYGGVLPLACLLLSRLFRDEEDAHGHRDGHIGGPQPM